MFSSYFFLISSAASSCGGVWRERLLILATVRNRLLPLQWPPHHLPSACRSSNGGHIVKQCLRVRGPEGKARGQLGKWSPLPWAVWTEVWGGSASLTAWKLLHLKTTDCMCLLCGYVSVFLPGNKHRLSCRSWFFSSTKLVPGRKLVRLGGKLLGLESHHVGPSIQQS